MSSKKTKKVVTVAILGSGFGALHAAMQLRKERRRLPKNIEIKVDLISRTDYFWLVTMAHEIATGNLMPNDVVQPIRSLPISIYDDFIQAEITKIHTKTNTVSFNLIDQVHQGIEQSQARSYDYIVSALGAETFYFGVPGAEKFALPIKTLDDVKKIKNRILQSYEDAELLDDVTEIAALLNFVIVGGGATGVEVAGELADMINVPMAKRYPRVAKYASITIVHGGKQLGIPGQDWMSSELEDILQRKHCVRIMCDSFVTEVSQDGVKVGEQFIPSKNVIWSGGVTASKVEIVSDNDIVRNKQGRIGVRSDLVLEVKSSIFVVGDQAQVVDEVGVDYPMRAQFAVRQGQLAAKNIAKDIMSRDREIFSYKDKGVIVSLGDGEALAGVGPLKIKGRIAYWMYKMVYIPQIIGFRAKVKTTVSWFLNLFNPRDLSKL